MKNGKAQHWILFVYGYFLHFTSIKIANVVQFFDEMDRLENEICRQRKSSSLINIK